MDTKQFLRSILDSLQQIDYVKPEDVPNIDLYMDQVTTFMDSQLAASKRHDDDKILTKTMINNYAKNNLLPPPEKKNLMKDLAKKFNTSMNTFPDASEDEADLLHTFSFICMLSYDVYIKKTLIEKMIDQMASKNPETKPSKK